MKEKRRRECTCTYMERKSDCVSDTGTGHEVKVHPPATVALTRSPIWSDASWSDAGVGMRRFLEIKFCNPLSRAGIGVCRTGQDRAEDGSSSGVLISSASGWLWINWWEYWYGLISWAEMLWMLGAVVRGRRKVVFFLHFGEIEW